MKSPFVIVISGPTGGGKTTLSKMLSKVYGCEYISEDETTKEVIPDVYKSIENYPEKVIIAIGQLFIRTNEKFNRGECVVIDGINFGKEFIEEITKAFQGHLIFKVLWPPIEVAIERDRRREGWNSGEMAIKIFYKIYEELKPIIGEENYIDNSRQTPEETLERIIACVEQRKPGI
jgi:dephospho-CoA kinase